MKNSTILAIDTSGPWLQLCLKTGGKNYKISRELPRGHAELLFDEITALLQQNYSEFSKITDIIVAVGPGSFTGLRIGIAAARGLGLALDINVIGIPNLFALSLGIGDGPFSIILDARRQQFYAQRFASAGVPIDEPQLLDLDQAGQLKSSKKSKILSDPKIDIELVCDFALDANSTEFPPLPTYVRPADAKPQTKMQIARTFPKTSTCTAV